MLNSASPAEVGWQWMSADSSVILNFQTAEAKDRDNAGICLAVGGSFAFKHLCYRE